MYLFNVMASLKKEPGVYIKHILQMVIVTSISRSRILLNNPFYGLMDQFI